MDLEEAQQGECHLYLVREKGISHYLYILSVMLNAKVGEPTPDSPVKREAMELTSIVMRIPVMPK